MQVNFKTSYSKAENMSAKNLDDLIISEYPEVVYVPECQSPLEYFITQSFPASALDLNHTLFLPVSGVILANLKDTRHIHFSIIMRSLYNQ